MLLAEIFEQFRETCHRNYGLDPAHYYTLPGYTGDCVRKYTGCKLETVQDVDILMFIERGCGNVGMSIQKIAKNQQGNRGIYRRTPSSNSDSPESTRRVLRWPHRQNL